MERCDRHQEKIQQSETNESRNLESPENQKRTRKYVAPRNEIEAGVAEILGKLLKIDLVGAHDNFIILGGESLHAAQAARRIRDRFGCEVTLRTILAGDVADIAAEIMSANP